MFFALANFDKAIWLNSLCISLTNPPCDPRGFVHSDCPGPWVFIQVALPGSRRFELEKFSTVLKEKRRNFLICFQETGGRLKSRCFVLFRCQFLQKQQMSTVSLITWTIFSHSGYFDKIVGSSKSHVCEC